ncbi:group II intron reverse transcriptase/maturase [Sphingobium sp.]|uniref:group II intron reverse transcriptase/maturase n=1 Tax=Sphingobium sp. TaxID=1912891 RepID=UPI0028BD3092|nr:group II intron reverse transcriptase/maturase [Sphingobium sp.]
MVLCSLHHVIDLDWMKEAYRLTRKDGAPGIDGVTAADYEVDLEVRLLDLLERIKSGRYRAPPVRRAYIPKADGSQRMLGIPTFEDKVAQRAITMVLEAIYEEDFYPCSYGFRPGRSAHQALRNMQNVLWEKRLHWVIDLDIQKYFDSIPHSHLRTFLDQRVTDGVIRRMIDKWLNAGAVEDGLLRRSALGSPQGGVISPCLSNIFLHHVLDEWFETEVRPRLRGECTLARYADDAVMAFDNIVDANRVLTVLGKRLGRYGLTLHPDKTRLVDFRPRRTESTRHPETDGTNFDFLGLTHVWGRSRRGKDMVLQVTAKGRFARALAAVSDWCRKHRHWSIRDQHRHLSSMMRGHFAYYGVGGNSRRLRWYAQQVVKIWQKWLSRRDRQSWFHWDRLNEIIRHHPLPSARVVHSFATVS